MIRQTFEHLIEKEIDGIKFNEDGDYCYNDVFYVGHEPILRAVFGRLGDLSFDYSDLYLILNYIDVGIFNDTATTEIYT